MLLLQHNADVCIMNGEGKLPRDMTQASESGREIAKLLRAAEETQALRKEAKLLSAAREGNIIELNLLVWCEFWFLDEIFHLMCFRISFFFAVKGYEASTEYQLCRQSRQLLFTLCGLSWT